MCTGQSTEQQRQPRPSERLQQHTVVPAINRSRGRATHSSWINTTSHQRRAHKEHWSVPWLRYSSQMPADVEIALPAWSNSATRTPTPLGLSTTLFFAGLTSSLDPALQISFHKEHCSASRSCWRSKLKLPAPKSLHDQTKQQQIAEPIAP